MAINILDPTKEFHQDESGIWNCNKFDYCPHQEFQDAVDCYQKREADLKMLWAHLCDDCINAVGDLLRQEERKAQTYIMLATEMGREIVDHICLNTEEPDMTPKCRCSCTAEGRRISAQDLQAANLAIDQDSQEFFHRNADPQVHRNERRYRNVACYLCDQEDEQHLQFHERVKGIANALDQFKAKVLEPKEPSEHRKEFDLYCFRVGATFNPLDDRDEALEAYVYEKYGPYFEPISFEEGKGEGSRVARIILSTEPSIAIDLKNGWVEGAMSESQHPLRFPLYRDTLTELRTVYDYDEEDEEE